MRSGSWWGGNLKDRDSSYKLGIGRNVLHVEISLKGMSCFNLAQNRDKKGSVIDKTCINILLVIYLLQIKASRVFLKLTLSIYCKKK